MITSTVEKSDRKQINNESIIKTFSHKLQLIFSWYRQKSIHNEKNFHRSALAHKAILNHKTTCMTLIIANNDDFYEQLAHLSSSTIFNNRRIITQDYI